MGVGADWRSEGVGTQEGCRDGPVRDAPSGRDTAWGVFVVINILQNIICTNMSRDEPIHTNGIKTNKQLVLPVCSNQNIIVLK